MTASWSDFVAEAPELAAAIRGRFESNLHHVIGTIRVGGAPRLSGTELHFDDEDVTVGMMPASRKLADVQRDPRVEIHCAPLVSAADGSDAHDAKLAGTLVATGPTEGPAGTSFRLDLAMASQVRVDANQLVITVWRPGRGVRETRRA